MSIETKVTNKIECRDEVNKIHLSADIEHGKVQNIQLIRERYGSWEGTYISLEQLSPLYALIEELHAKIQEKAWQK